MRRVLLLLTLVPLVAGCGATDKIDPVAEAAAKTREVSSARFVIVMKVRDPKEGNLTIRGPGEIDDNGRLMHMKMTMPASQLDLGRGSVTFEMFTSGRDYYFRGRPFAPLLRPGKEWIRIRDDQPIPELGQNDPGAMLDYLKATSEVKEVGKRRVRGVETTLYHARIQLSKVAELASPEAKRQVEQITRRPGFSGIKEIPLDVWVDKEGLVRRMTMDWHPEGGSLVLDMELFDFGRDMGLQIPPAAKTITIDLPVEE
jgi:hypothetical protein